MRADASSCCTDSRARGRAWEPWPSGWTRQRYRPLAPDLRGHGDGRRRAADRLRRGARPTSWPRRPAAFALSATRWAAGSRCTSRSRRPSASTRLVLVSTTAGIEDEAERAAPARRRTPTAAAIASGRRSRPSPTAGCAQPLSPTTRRRPGAARARHPAQRPVGAGRRAARARAPGRWRRSGTGWASCAGPPRSSSRGARREVHRAGPSAWRGALPAARTLRRRRRARATALPRGGRRSSRVAAAIAARGPRRRGPARWARRCAPSSSSRTSNSPANSAQRAEPAGRASAAAPRRSARAAAIPSGPSKVEAT